MEINLHSTQNIRLDEFLRLKLPEKTGDCSNSKIRRLIIAGCVNVNNKTVTRPSFELRGKSLVKVSFDKEKFFYEKQPDDIAFVMEEKDVLFEDKNLIFVNKPSHFPVEQTITGNRNNLHDAVVDFLWKRNPELRNPPYVGIMHRLDKDTSGVILFTKTREINKDIHDMFENHDFTKEYFAVVCDKGKKLKKGSKFTVEKFIGRISSKSQSAKWGTLSEKEGGLYSKTDFEVSGFFEENGELFPVVKCNLFTGRTHQIRVHLSEAGFSILGDVLYGGKDFKRIMLHSARLACNKTDALTFDVKAPVPWKNQ